MQLTTKNKKGTLTKLCGLDFHFLLSKQKEFSSHRTENFRTVRLKCPLGNVQKQLGYDNIYNLSVKETNIGRIN